MHTPLSTALLRRVGIAAVAAVLLLAPAPPLRAQQASTPATPSGFAAADAGGGSVQLSWTAVSGVDHYVLVRNSTQIATPAAGATSYVDTGACAGDQYALFAVAADGTASTPATATAPSTVSGNACASATSTPTPTSTPASTPTATPTAAPTPAAPTLNAPAPAVTNQTTVALTGSATAGAVVSVAWTDTARDTGSANATAASDGSFSASFDLSATGDGAYTFSAYQTVAGVSGPASAGVSVTIDTVAPGPPTALQGGVTAGGQVALTWAAPSASDLAGYTVQRRTGSSGTYATIATLQDPTATSYTDAGPTGGFATGTTYGYRVAAVDAAGNASTWATATVTTGADTQAPTWPASAALTTSQVGSTSVTLTWPAATDNVGVTDYDLYLDSAQTPQVLGASTLTTTVSGLSPGTQHTFVVQPVDAAGNAGAPLGASATTAADMTPPAWPSSAALTATPAQTSVDLAWSPAATDAVGVIAYRLLQGTTVIQTLTASASQYSVTGLTAGTAYTFAVEAGDAAGNWSAALSASVTTTSPDTTPPAWPAQASLATSNVAQDAATAGWPAATDNVGVTAYRVSLGGQVVATGPGTVSSYTFHNLAPATTYAVKVEAGDAAGNWSAPLSASVTTAAFPGPGGLAATPGTTSVQLSWTAPAGVSDLAGYTVERAGSAVAQLGAAATSYTDKSLSAATAYDYSVVATDAVGNSATSTVSTTTLTPGTTIQVPADCTLVQAMRAAQDGNAAGACGSGTMAAPYTIVLDPAQGPYVLTSVDNYTDGPNGLAAVIDDVTVKSAGPGRAVIERGSGAAAFRFFQVSAPETPPQNVFGNAIWYPQYQDGIRSTTTAVSGAGGSLTLQDLELRGGLAAGGEGYGCGGGGLGAGGAIFSHGAPVTLIDSVLAGNAADGGGSNGGTCSGGGGGMGGAGGIGTGPLDVSNSVYPGGGGGGGTMTDGYNSATAAAADGGDPNGATPGVSRSVTYDGGGSGSSDTALVGASEGGFGAGGGGFGGGYGSGGGRGGFGGGGGAGGPAGTGGGGGTGGFGAGGGGDGGGTGPFGTPASPGTGGFGGGTGGVDFGGGGAGMGGAVFMLGGSLTITGTTFTTNATTGGNTVNVGSTYGGAIFFDNVADSWGNATINAAAAITTCNVTYGTGASANVAATGGANLYVHGTIAQTTASGCSGSGSGPGGGSTPSPTAVSLAAASASPVAGQDDVVTATVTDAAGNTVASQVVTFILQSGRGSLSATSATTDASGKASVTYHTATSIETATIAVSVVGAAGVTNTVSIASAAPAAAVSLAAASASPVAGQDDVVTATVTDAAGNTLASRLVTFSVAGGTGTLSATAATTDANGQAAVTYHTAGSVETARIDASVNSASATTAALAITSVAGPPDATASTLSASPHGTIVGGTVQVAGVIRDAHQNPIAGATIALDDGGAGGTFASATATTAADGSFAVGYTVPASPGVATLTATVSGVAVSTTAVAVAASPMLPAGFTTPQTMALSPTYATDFTAFVGGANALYRSADGGGTWTDVTPPQLAVTVSIRLSATYASDQTLFVVSGGGELYRSTDGGAHWTTLQPQVSFGGSTVAAAAGRVALSPWFDSDHTVVMAARLTADHDNWHLYRSTDAGATWSEVGGSVLQTRDITTVAAAPGAGGAATFFAGTTAGLFRSVDGGASWTRPTFTGFAVEDVTALAVSPTYASNHELVAGAVAGIGGPQVVMRSHDGGDTWSPADVGLAGALVDRLAYAEGPAGDQTLLADLPTSVSWSMDGAATWRPVAAVGAGGYLAIAVPPTMGGSRSAWLLSSSALFSVPLTPTPHWSFAPRSIAPAGSLAPGATVALVLTARDTAGHPLAGVTAVVAFFATSGGGSASAGGAALTPSVRSVTTDARGQVHILYTAPATLPTVGTDRLTVRFASTAGTTEAATSYRFDAPPDGAWETNAGRFPGGAVSAVAVAPQYATDRTVFAATAQGLYRSTDGGGSWLQVSTVVTDATTIAVSPAFDSDGTAFAGFNGGLYRSTDGGDSWQRVGDDLTGGDPVGAAAGAVSFAPDYAQDPVVFMGAAPYYAYRSPDGGTSWAVEPMVGSGANTESLSRVFPAPNMATSGLALGTAASVPVRSTDGGHTWQFISQPATTVYWIGFSPSFATDGTIFEATGDGVYRSSDGGTTWHLVADGFPGLNGAGMFNADTRQWLVVSPAYPSDHTLSWVTLDGNMYRSRDGGDTWSLLRPRLPGNVAIDGVAAGPGSGADGVIFVASPAGLLSGPSLGTLAHIALTPSVPSLVYGDTLSATVRVTDDHGNGQAGVVVRVRSTLGGLAFPRTTVTTGPDGTATVSLQGRGTPGEQGELQAWIAGVAAPAAARVPFSVVAGAPSSLTFDSLSACGSCIAPGTTHAGISIPLLKVGVLNSAGQVIADYSGPVTLSIAPGTGSPDTTLQGTTTINAVNGIAPFDNLVSIADPADGYRLIASIPGTPGAQGESPSFDIIADLGTPPADTGTAGVDPNSSSQVKSTDGAIDVSVPRGAVHSTGEVWVEPRSTHDAPPPPAGDHIVKAFKLDLFNPDGHLQSHPHFAHPLTIRVHYTQADAASVNGDLSRLKVTVFLTSTNAWATLNTTVDAAHMELVATVDHFTLFAIQAAPPPTPAPVIPPVVIATPVPTPAPTATPTPTPLAGAAPTQELGGVSVDVVHARSLTASATAAASVTADGTSGSATVEVPAGALPAGATVSVGEVADAAGLAAQAPPPAGSLAAAFEVSATAVDGSAVRDGFAHPVALRFTIGADALPAAATAGELTIAYWDGTRWGAVATAVTANGDGTYTLAATTDHFTLFSVLDLPGFATLRPAPRAVGINAAAWGGGSFAALRAQAPDAVSFWTFRAGRAYDWIPGAPAFVTQGFDELFPSGMVPVGEIVLVAR